MSVHDTIAAKQRAMIPTRLVRGAEILGRLWREGIRCRSEWSGICPCEPQNDFCRAKRRWLDLVMELHDGKYPNDVSANEGFLVLECMDQASLDASGLTILKALPGSRVPIRVGRNGTCLQTILDLQSLQGTPDYEIGLECVIRIQEIL